MKLRPAGSDREAALQVIYQVTEKEAYASLTLDKILNNSRLEAPERALATELAYTAIKAWGTLDWALSLFLSRSLNKLPPWIRCLLRLGAAQLLYIPRIPPRAAIYETVELTKKYGHRGTVGLVNAVLRRLSKRVKKGLPYPEVSDDPAGYLALRYYHPLWLINEWLNQFGYQETETLCQLNNQPPPVVIRANTLKIGLEALVERLQLEEHNGLKRSCLVPEGLILEKLGSAETSFSFREGLFYIQDEGSQLVSHALGPVSGAVVIDACAAPGGKSTHLAQLMGNKGTILAADVHSGRLELIKDNCRRLGVTCVQTLLLDARQLGSRYRGIADYLLIDAPCSGTGVLRRRADIRWRQELDRIRELAQLQLEILLGARQTLKLGGILIYSTCSVAPEENEQVIQKFLAEAKEFSLVPLELPVIPNDLRATAQEGWLQFLPQKHGTDGFFICRLQKTGN